MALLCATLAVALVLARHFHSDPAAILVSVLGGVPGLYLAYAAYRDDRSAAGEAISLAEMADQFAAAVRAEWQEEAAVRRINDPYPLPVRWVPADPSLFDQWSALLRLAASGAGWPRAAGPWAGGPGELGGEDGELVQVLTRVPTGRLVVLGEPGAGKSVLMMRLVLDLLARRASGDRVPVLVSAASWDPATQDLHGWLAGQLTFSYATLAGPAPADAAAPSSIRALLRAGFILPILDGLDEIPDAARGPAIARINDALRPGEQLVVTCRRAQFRDAVRPVGRPHVTLRGAVGVELSPLDADAVASYLYADAAEADAQARWRPVASSLRKDTPLAAALSSPLMVGLARVIYNPRPGELAGAMPDPADLCAFPSQAAIEDHLLGAFIPAAYRRAVSPSGRARHWTADSAEKWLGYLAGHLEHEINGLDLEWWQLIRSVPRPVIWVATGLVTGLVAAVATEVAFVALAMVAAALFGGVWGAMPTVGVASVTGLRFGSFVALASGLASGAVAAAAAGGAGRTMHRARLIRRARSLSLPAASVTVGILTAVAAWYWFQYWLSAGLGVAAALLVAWSGHRAHADGKHLDFREATAAGIGVGVLVGVYFGVITGVLFGSYAEGVTWGLTWGPISGMAAAAGIVLKGGHSGRPARVARWSLRTGALGAVSAGVAAALVGVLSGGSAFTLPLGLVFGLTAGLAAGAVTGLESIPSDPSAGMSPPAVLARARRTTLLLALITGIAAGTAVGLISGSIISAELGGYPSQMAISFGLGTGIGIGLAIGAGFGLAVGGFGSAWPQWLIARYWLAAYRRLPLRLIAFLDDAHHRGVLRQTGASYQFRHIKLQRRLANHHHSHDIKAAGDTS